MIQETLKYISENSDRYVDAIARHLEIALMAIVISFAIAIPLGYFCAKNEKLAMPVLGVANLLKTIPSIAKFILMLPFFGIGITPTLVALVIMVIPTLLISTMTGIQGIDPQIVESANGMGLGKIRTCFSVEVPLALPSIINGMRIAVIQIITGTTIASYIGAGGLGDFIYIGLGLNRTEIMLAGAYMVAFISIFLDTILSMLQKRIRRNVQ